MKKKYKIIRINEADTKKSIGEKLKEIRLHHGLKSKEMAEIIGVKDNTYSEYESGKTQPSLKVLINIAITFETSLDYITNITDYTNTYKHVELAIFKKSNHIPYMKEAFIAGQSIYGYSLGYINATKKYKDLNCDLFFTNKNDHMLPKYKKNDIILINSKKQNEFPIESMDYLIYLDGFNYIVTYHKGLFKTLNNPKLSFNYLNNERIQIIGIVVGATTKDKI